MLIDLHIHTKLCNHAIGEMYEYVESAINKDFSEIGFSDHFPMFYLPKNIDISAYCMKIEEMQIYMDQIKRLKEKYNDEIRIKTGIEVDYIIGKDEVIKKSLKKYDFDYILGSVHVIDDWCIDDPENLDKYSKYKIIDIYKGYYYALNKAINSRIFDVMAHLDLVKKFGFYPNEDYEYLIDIVIDSLKKNKINIELNTAGDRKPVNEFYPSRKILEKCYQNDIQITLGSDAHKPDEVGWKFNQAIQLLKEVGYNQIITFKSHKIEYIEI